ncbi:MAG: hypothetical protein QXE78_07500 [Nitrososphaeria archaeon]
MRSLYIFLALSIALVLRLYPTIVSGLPFSVDAWSPIRNTELLIEYTPIRLDDEVFDGYNNYWPGVSLFGAVFSQVTGIRPINLMAAIVPLAGGLTVLFFYALISRLSQNHKLAFFASILLATAFPYTLFMSGVTKETYANPIYMLSILIFLGSSKWRKILLFTIVSVALVLSHHLTTLVTIAVLASITLASSIARAGKGLSFDNLRLILVSILTATAALYFILFAYRGLKLALTASDILSVASYQTISFAAALYLTLKPHNSSRARTLLLCSSSAAIVSLSVLLCTKRPIVPEAPILPSHYILYAVPFILASPLVVLGLGRLREMQCEECMLPFFWFTTILGLEGYAVFGNSPLGLTLAYRTLNFLCIPLAILCAAGLERLYMRTNKPLNQRLKNLVATASLLLILTINSYNMYAAVSLQERYMGYFWLYRLPEYRASAWISTAAEDQVVAGDMKASPLLKEYFNVNVDVLQGLRYLTGKASSEPKILYIYNQMQYNGYVFYGGYTIDMPIGWTEKTFALNLIYSNGLVKVHKGVEGA